MLEQQLRSIPFFRHLPAEALEAIASRLRLETYERGAVVFRRGDPSEAMYLVHTGQVDVVMEGGEVETSGDRQPIASLGPGSFVGELGLLLDQPRSATLVAVADVELWALGRDDLDALLAEHPAVAVDLSRELGRRLVATTRRIAPPALTRVTAVWGEGAAELAGALLALGGGRVGILALAGSNPPHLPPEVKTVSGELLEAEAIAGLRGRQVEDLDHLLVALPLDVTGAARAAVEAAEHLVAFEDYPPGWTARPGLSHRVLRCDGSPGALRRVARWISGRAVGLALSSGGSKSVAHLGVIRVLRGAGVEIDAVAGTSGGALAAAGVAFGVADEQMMAWARELARHTKFRRFDYNPLPRAALFKGVKLRNLFESWLAGLTFTDAPLPLWVVATDVTTGDEVVIGEGPVSDGLRASMSVPAAFNPWPWGGKLLVDGAVVNPMPASVLRDAGIRYVIGSNVAGQELVTGREGKVPHMLQIMSRIMNSMEREMIKAQIPLVDVLVRPRLGASGTFDFGHMETFVAEGERAARERLDDIAELTGAKLTGAGRW